VCCSWQGEVLLASQRQRKALMQGPCYTAAMRAPARLLLKVMGGLNRPQQPGFLAEQLAMLHPVHMPGCRTSCIRGWLLLSPSQQMMLAASLPCCLSLSPSPGLPEPGPSQRLYSQPQEPGTQGAQVARTQSGALLQDASHPAGRTQHTAAAAAASPAVLIIAITV
jgi:hypothetical protein